MYKGSSRIVIIFKRVRWGERVNGHRTLFKMLITMHCIKGSLKNQHFQRTLLGGKERVAKNSTLGTHFIMLTIMDDPGFFNDGKNLVTK